MNDIPLRLSITDRCNLRCVYCMPPEGVPYVDHKFILRYETMVQAARILNMVRPLRKVRITGGEPLVRKGVATMSSVGG
ncbi:MAG: radical SAM protein [Acidobacteriota bacterium]